MKILHLTASHRWTGAAEPAARVAATQTQQGHDVLFAMTTGRSFEQKARALGVNVTDAIPFERSYLPHKKWRDGKALQSLVAKFQPDIIHTHLTHDHALAAAFVGHREKKNPLLIRTFHRETPPRRDPLMKFFVMPRTQGCIAISSGLANALKETHGLSSEQVATIGGGIDTELYQPRNRAHILRQRWGIAPDKVVIGLVSRLRLERGVGWLLDAAEKALTDLPKAHLVICGRGNYQDEMVERLKTHPAKEQITYAGYVQGQDLFDSYEAFDVGLMLKPGNDGACRSALEAMATGKPVIGGDLGAIHDLLSGEPTSGWLAKPDDADALAQAIRDSVLNEEDRIAYGRNARQRILDKYSEEAMGLQTLEFYESLLKRMT